MARRISPTFLRRFFSLAIVLLAIPAALSITVFVMDQPVRLGERSPRTIVAPDLIRVPDPEATARARRQAADEVEPVLVDDQEAKAAIVQNVRDAFAAVRDARAPDQTGRRAKRGEQKAAMRQRLPMLGEEALDLLVRLDDDEVAQVSAEALSVAQLFARQRITQENVTTAVEEQLPTELVVRSFPPGVANSVVDPIIRGSLRPTVREDVAATQERRESAAAAVSEVIRSYPAFSVIVAAGDTPDEVQIAALKSRGLEGSEPWRPIVKALLIALILTVAVSGYLRTYRTALWRSSRRVLLLAVLFLGFSLALEVLALLEPSAVSGWRYAAPVGAVVMLATILFDPPVGILVALPAAVLVGYTTQGETGPTVFAAVAALVSVPLVTRLSSRKDLRRAAWQSTLLYGVLAGMTAIVFADATTAPIAILGGLINGVVTAMLVNTSLPFLETSFKVVTATSLLDLADRNHPLLRELEQRALGSYNHSILVSTMVERACRAIGADALLGSTAALYHDIGKVRQPWFFVENQFGIANPHDELEPDVSALIIQEHVTDGISMAKSYRLPPEIVEGIATHHGTTVVTYFYRRALEHAHPGDHVDESQFRYKGRKPASKEMAVLMLADCTEGASRATAQNNRNLSRQDLENIVYTLVAERVDDGQLDESSLTFHELRTVQESFIETLTGVYHPRIAYPPPIARKGDQAELPSGAPSPSALTAKGDGEVTVPTGG
ncbi:MAG: HDIG domain-containing protein [Nitriliruptorales bacterium]|nr:HDIG domain-containing protein [Nitriliruptorales bacterium]